MKIRIGPFQEDNTFSPNDEWTPLREFSIKDFQTRAIPLCIGNTALFAFLWIRWTPVAEAWGTVPFPVMIFQNLAILVSVIVIHELIHALIHPSLGFSEQTVIRFWPSKMFVCTYYLGEITRNRGITVQIMPFVVLSIVPLAISVVAQTAQLWLAYTSIVNAFIASGDIVAIIMTMRELPRGAIIRTTGWNGYYRIHGK